jgi:glutamine amidotransferase
MRATIVDYGMANLRSVQKAIEAVGGQAEVTADPNRVAAAERLIVPGVGAFRDAMARLRETGLAEVIQTHVRADRPFFGICLGLQLLFEKGREDGEHQGLGLLPGTVERLAAGPGVKVPHMGWNQVRATRPHPYLATDIDGGWFYFVHSYAARPSDPELTLLTADHGETFTAAVAHGRLFATQFHPEKSQAIGRRLLQRFLLA